MMIGTFRALQVVPCRLPSVCFSFRFALKGAYKHIQCIKLGYIYINDYDSHALLLISAIFMFPILHWRMRCVLNSAMVA